MADEIAQRMEGEIRALIRGYQAGIENLKRFNHAHALAQAAIYEKVINALQHVLRDYESVGGIEAHGGIIGEKWGDPKS